MIGVPVLTGGGGAPRFGVAGPPPRAGAGAAGFGAPGVRSPNRSRITAGRGLDHAGVRRPAAARRAPSASPEARLASASATSPSRRAPRSLLGPQESDELFLRDDVAGEARRDLPELTRTLRAGGRTSRTPPLRSGLPLTNSRSAGPNGTAGASKLAVPPPAAEGGAADAAEGGAPAWAAAGACGAAIHGRALEEQAAATTGRASSSVVKLRRHLRRRALRLVHTDEALRPRALPSPCSSAFRSSTSCSERAGHARSSSMRAMRSSSRTGSVELVRARPTVDQRDDAGPHPPRHRS